MESELDMVIAMNNLDASKEKAETQRLNQVGARVMKYELHACSPNTGKELKEPAYFKNNLFVCWCKDFSPATDMNNAMMVLRELRKKGWEFTITLGYDYTQVIVRKHTAYTMNAPFDQEAHCIMLCVEKALKGE